MATTTFEIHIKNIPSRTLGAFKSVPFKETTLKSCHTEYWNLCDGSCNTNIWH